MPKKSPHPHVAWRDGRPRFQPGPELRAAGHKAKDLRHDGGRWFSRGEAVDWSDAFVKQLAAARKADQAKAKAAVVAAPRYGRPALFTVGQMFEDWYRSPKFQLPTDPEERRRQVQAKIVYAPKSIVDYKQKARVIEDDHPDLYASPVDALEQAVVFAFYEQLVAARGLATARGVIATLSVALAWAKRRGKTKFRMNNGVNPAQDLGMSTPPPRVRFGTRTEIYTLVAVADHVEWYEVGDMTLLGVWTGQRQRDRLDLEDRGLLNGRRIFRQSKTGAVVAIRQAPELERRLAASQERRRAAKAEALLAAETLEERRAVERRFARVILNELVDKRFGKCLWQTYQGQTYSHRFQDVRDLAVKGIRAENGVDWLIKPCPSLADFIEPDLRDTAVTWLALAGATVPEICSITGHSFDSATRILKHYLARHPEMADAAIAKMIAWHEADGETEIGL
ncbi:putative Integrase family protein [Mesorhizobium plurifarium]|uniref:Putative Integrase family protein n=1 Tax=Mesorhizobium plurifarium TaxID=69974 RepID=A0A0K2VVJ4_MESPL|nr:putative Integrase family protein [Mesorhizobium plurifarium]